MNQYITTELDKTFSAPVLHTVTVRPRTGRKATLPTPKPQKRDNTFSQSRDSREDRGTRQMKSKHNSQTFPHVR